MAYNGNISYNLPTRCSTTKRESIVVITYKPITDLADFDRATDLEVMIWGTVEREAIGSHTTQVIVHTGGCMLGAYDGEQLIGFVVGLATRDPKRLWSHIAAVHPEYQRQGIGAALKFFQRDWALEQGYSIMQWTFDPMLAPNANFNFNVLGVMCNTFHENFYGFMQDEINKGMPSDRFQVTWDLKQAQSINHPEEMLFLLTKDDKDSPIKSGSPLENEYYAVEIPQNFNRIKEQNVEQAMRWKLVFRGVISDAFAQGYMAVAFVRESNRCYYVLKRVS